MCLHIFMSSDDEEDFGESLPADSYLECDNKLDESDADVSDNDDGESEEEEILSKSSDDEATEFKSTTKITKLKNNLADTTNAYIAKMRSTSNVALKKPNGCLNTLDTMIQERKFVPFELGKFLKNSQNLIIKTGKNNSNHLLVVCLYTVLEKVSIKFIRDLVLDIENFSVGRSDGYIIKQFVLVSPLNLTPMALTQLLQVRNIQVTMFNTQELMRPFFLHQTIPYHVAINEQETADLLRKFRITIDKLAKVQLNDPLVKFYGWSEGTVVKITRKFYGKEPYVTYRLVV